MAGLTERLALIVDANTRGATRGLDNLGRSAKQNLGQAETGIEKFKRSFRDAGPMIAGAAAAATAGVAAFLSLSNSAKELSAATGAVDSIFGDTSEQVRRFAIEAENLGLSQTKASQIASGLGGQLKSMGFTAEEAGGRVALLTERAADMAVGLGTTEQAVQSIAALIRGEGDPIERFGVSIKQSDVNARLAAQGLSGLEGEAKRTAETTARLDLLFEQTADRVGLYGSEANAAARESAELSAKSENLRAELGEKLLPVYVDVMDAMGKFVDAGSGVIEVMEGIGDTASAVIPDLNSFGDALSSALPGWARAAAGAAGAVVGAFGGVMRENEELGLVLLGASLEDIHPELGLVTGSLAENEEQTKDTAEAYESLFASAFKVQDALSAIDDSSSETAKAHSALSNAQRGAVSAAEAVRDAQMDVAEAMAASFDATDAARQGIADYAAEQRAATDPIFAFIRALERQDELLGTAAGPDAKVVRRDSANVSATAIDKPSLLDLATGAAGVEQAAIGLAGAIQSGDLTLDQARQSLAKYERQGSLTAKQVASLTKIVEDAAKKAMDLEGATVEQAIASEVAAEKAEFEAEKADDVREARERLEDANRRYADAQDRVREATDKVSTAQSNAVLKAEALDQALFDLNGEVRENPGLIFQAKEQLDKWVQRGLLPANEAAATLKTLIGDVNTALATFGQDGDATAEIRVNADIGQLIGVTEDPTLRRALQNMWAASLQSALLAMDPSGNNLDIGAVGVNLTPRAHGGPTSAGGTYLVGEQGPELLQMGRTNGFVFNNGQTQQMLGGGSKNYSIVINNPAGQTAESSIRRELRRAEYLSGAR